jgi:hypothetical protein
VLALLCDVQANLPALEAVVDAAERAGVSGYLVGGDAVSSGPWPAETLSLQQIATPATGRRRWLTGRCVLGRLARGDPALEGFDALVRPGAVAGHGASPESVQDGVGVLADLFVRPEIEREAHRPSVSLTEERFDVLVEAERLVCCWCVHGMLLLGLCSKSGDGAPGVASQTHHQRGMGMCIGGLAPGVEFSTAIREPHST